jgi:serine/threonine protein kinase
MVSVLGKMPPGFESDVKQNHPDYAEKLLKMSGKLRKNSLSVRDVTADDDQANLAVQNIIPGDDDRAAWLLDLITRLLHFDPKYRMTAKDALEHQYLIRYLDDSAEA